MPKFKKYFAITAGRTGTAWLADFLSLNIGIKCIHEPSGILDFGVNMPDIKTMRAFNEWGNCELVKDFWKRKIQNVMQSDEYAETNHTLAKCGLVENIAPSELADETVIIILRRDKVKQCVSYLVRGDFANTTIAWQWYLHPGYKRKIVDFSTFMNLGAVGPALWYVFEMDARQTYYKTLYGKKLKFVEVDLEQITTKSGAGKFLKMLGINKEAVLPPPKNLNKAKPDEKLVEHVENLLSSINFDSQKVVDAFLASGARLG